MPIYEYYCAKCEQVKSEIQKFSDEPLTDCENCGAKGSLSKLISQSAFHLKGSGWYAKDSKVVAKPAQPVKTNPDGTTTGAVTASGKVAEGNEGVGAKVEKEKSSAAEDTSTAKLAAASAAVTSKPVATATGTSNGAAQ